MTTSREAVYGAGRIFAERQRQIVLEGHTPEADQAYRTDQLIDAAISYLVAVKERRRGRLLGGQPVTPHEWPWDFEFFKPKNDDADLARAGALVAAEMDRVKGTLL